MTEQSRNKTNLPIRTVNRMPATAAPADASHHLRRQARHIPIYEYGRGDGKCDKESGRNERMRE